MSNVVKLVPQRMSGEYKAPPPDRVVETAIARGWTPKQLIDCFDPSMSHNTARFLLNGWYVMTPEGNVELADNIATGESHD